MLYIILIYFVFFVWTFVMLNSQQFHNHAVTTIWNNAMTAA